MQDTMRDYQLTKADAQFLKPLPRLGRWRRDSTGAPIATKFLYEKYKSPTQLKMRFRIPKPAVVTRPLPRIYLFDYTRNTVSTIAIRTYPVNAKLNDRNMVLVPNKGSYFAHNENYLVVDYVDGETIGFASPEVFRANAFLSKKYEFPLKMVKLSDTTLEGIREYIDKNR